MLAIEGDELICEAEISASKWIGLKISEVSDVSFLSEGTAVVFIMWVIVRTCSCTSLGEIPKLMDVNSMFAVGVEPFD